MKRQPFFSKTSSPHSQRGIATILIVVLIGVALTATAMSIMHSMRSTQEKSIAVHAVTNAQTGAWAGVEAFRRYLMTLDGAALDAGLPTEITVALGEGGLAYGSMKATEVSVEDDGDRYKINATITNTLEAAHASAAVGVVYEVAKGDDCPGCVTLTAALDFHDDLNLSGGIDFVTPPGSMATINVDGNVVFPGIEINRLGVLNATGTVDLDSQVQIEEINSNNKVTLKGAAYVDKVSTRGAVETIGGAGIGTIWANGAVTLGSSYNTRPLTTEEVNTRSSVNINMGNHGNFKAGEGITIGGAGSVGNLQAVGNIAVNSNTVIGEAIGEANFTCPNITWDDFTSISVNGSLNGCSPAQTFLSLVTTNANNDIEVMNEVPPVEIPRLVIDVWTLKQYANYIFEYDATKRRTKVTVYNINGITNGSVFYVGNYGGSENSYLCTEFSGTGEWANCTQPTTNKSAICLGHSKYNSCLSYDVNSNKWTFDGTSTAPGIMWFNGNVALNNGYNYATVLAAGNVSTAGSMTNESVNYAGFSEICRATGAEIPNPNNGGQYLRNDYNAMFRNRYPTNLCDIAESKYIPNNAGNIGIAAGGYNPNGNGSYSGGEINLGAATKVYGAVLAGTYLTTAGASTVYGYVSAAVQNGRGTKDNSLGGRTIVDTSLTTADYNPAVVPDMSEGSACTNCGGGGGGSTSGEVKVLWSKYL